MSRTRTTTVVETVSDDSVSTHLSFFCKTKTAAPGGPPQPPDGSHTVTAYDDDVAGKAGCCCFSRKK